MTKKDYVDIIWDWAYDNLEFDTDNEIIYYTKSQKEDFIKSLYDNDWSEKDVKIFKKEIESFSYLKEEHIKPTITIDNGRGGIDFEDLPDYYIQVEYELVEKDWKYLNIFEICIDKLKEGLYNNIKTIKKHKGDWLEWKNGKRNYWKQN